MIALEPLGDRAFLARFATVDEARGWAHAARSAGLRGVRDVVLAYRTVGIHVDTDEADMEALDASLRLIQPAETTAETGRLIALPVLYDGDDLKGVAGRLGLAEDDVVRLHWGCEYRVLAV